MVVVMSLLLLAQMLGRSPLHLRVHTGPHIRGRGGRLATLRHLLLLLQRLEPLPMLLVVSAQALANGRGEARRRKERIR